jgi:protease IV
MRWIKKVIVGLLSAVGLLTIITFLTMYYTFQEYIIPEERNAKLTDHSLLVLRLGDRPLAEGINPSRLNMFLSGVRQKSIVDIIKILNAAKEDSRIAGLIVKIEGNGFSLAHVQEIRAALKDFKQSKKPIYAYADTLGEGGNGTGAYYLSALAGEVWLQPRGSLNLTGMILESYFMRDLLDQYLIKPQLDKREAYKGIGESYTENSFSKESRENLQNLLNDLMDQIITDVAEDRKLDKTSFKQVVDQGPYSDQEALQLKLIDRLGHYDELKRAIQEKSEVPVSFVPDKDYAYSIQSQNGKAKIAMVVIDGTLYGNTSPLGDENPNSPRQIAKSLHRALEDKSIGAVILRVNSPGGTVTAAETIWHEVKKIKEAKKPIIVSMSSLAASAGYQIAVPALKIVANPATITGSIGVMSGKIILNKAFSNFGVHWDQIKSGANAGMWSLMEEFSPEGWKKLQSSLDYYYDDFLTKVAEGRGLDKAEVRKVAQGQVWTGRQAKEHKLVDELGGLSKAIEIAKAEIGLTPSDPVQLVHIVGKRGVLSVLLDIFELEAVHMIWRQAMQSLPVDFVSLQMRPLYLRE